MGEMEAKATSYSPPLITGVPFFCARRSFCGSETRLWWCVLCCTVLTGTGQGRDRGGEEGRGWGRAERSSQQCQKRRKKGLKTFNSPEIEREEEGLESQGGRKRSLGLFTPPREEEGALAPRRLQLSLERSCSSCQEWRGRSYNNNITHFHSLRLRRTRMYVVCINARVFLCQQSDFLIVRFMTVDESALS